MKVAKIPPRKGRILLEGEKPPAFKCEKISFAELKKRIKEGDEI